MIQIFFRVFVLVIAMATPEYKQLNHAEGKS